MNYSSIKTIPKLIHGATKTLHSATHAESTLIVQLPKLTQCKHLSSMLALHDSPTPLWETWPKNWVAAWNAHSYSLPSKLQKRWRCWKREQALQHTLSCVSHFRLFEGATTFSNPLSVYAALSRSPGEGFQSPALSSLFERRIFSFSFKLQRKNTLFSVEIRLGDQKKKACYIANLLNWGSLH